jgi:hypothetical protein
MVEIFEHTLFFDLIIKILFNLFVTKMFVVLFSFPYKENRICPKKKKTDGIWKDDVCEKVANRTSADRQ